MTLLLLALALSVDNFTIALAVGAQARQRTVWTTLRVPAVFAAFAVAAPAVGAVAGSQLAHALTKYGNWVACAILLYAGWRTLRSAWQSVNGGRDASSFAGVVALGLGTSIDSLAAGFAMALTDTNVALLAGVNGAVCALLSLAGMLLGERVAGNFPAQSRFAAGVILIALGLRTLLVHS